MTATFYDTHAHLDFPEFSSDLDAVLGRARDAGIVRIFTIGTDFESSRRAMALAEQHSDVYAVIGWHPTHCLEAPEDVRPQLREWVKHPRVAAIGETGVDHYRMPSQRSGGTTEDDERYRIKQEQVFRQQLEVAAESGLNVVIHQRAAWAATLGCLREFTGSVRGVFHCFSEDLASMREVLEIGHLVSFTGIVTFKNGTNVRDSVLHAPLDRFMLETDCPFLAPLPYRGKRCEPAYVQDIARMVSEVKGVSMEELGRATSSTADGFFRV
jgi:TatD DNase family protein